MTYLKEFKAQINSRNFPKFLQLWEEYSAGDQVDVEELAQILQAIRGSDFAKQFGKLIETALPLWQIIQDKEDSYLILRLLIDVQNTNSPSLGELVFQTLKARYGDEPQFAERMRLVGMRTRDNFQGALSNYDLLSHMEVGKFVFHSGGWGTGEVVDLSPIRQQVTVEFENVPGKKHFTFDNAFKSLIPLKNDHFYARRFATPDELEKEAREEPVAVIKNILQNLGPQTALELKDLLEERVIPEADWTKWWQATRAKLKKDPLIESPESLKDSFRLRKTEVSHQERLQNAIKNKTGVDQIIETAYDFLRDLTDTRKHQDVRDSLKEKLLGQLSNPSLTPQQELQIAICLENQFSYEIPEKSSKALIQKLDDVETAVNAIEIIALKKRALTLIRENRKDWVPLFINLLASVKHSVLREYLVKELTQTNKKELETFLVNLLKHPEKHPDFFVWYFQKVISGEKGILYSDLEGQYLFFDAFLVLMCTLENKPEYKELIKKMYTILSGKRYAIVRQIFEKASLENVKEFLLLASKCQTFTDHDKKILRSLAAVVYPVLGKGDQFADEDTENVIWTTEEGFLKVQDKLRHIGTVEVIENAREVEAARALGDLRENSEYKFAVERRGRLQGQLKTLSEQFKHARIITKDDIHVDTVSIGSVVDVVDANGKKVSYTILGPWDADPEKNILSFQSKLAQAMLGRKKGDKVSFRDEEYKIAGLHSFLDK